MITSDTPTASLRQGTYGFRQLTHALLGFRSALVVEMGSRIITLQSANFSHQRVRRQVRSYLCCCVGGVEGAHSSHDMERILE
jgi:hypothetical protein